jgi:recombination protein RecA
MSKDPALDAVVQQIEKDHGKGSIMKLGSKKFVAVDVIPTGSLALDVALGTGGIPRGRVVEIYGPESGGKTTLALQMIAQAQKLGGQAAYIDAEHALDPVYARKLGVDVDEMYVSQPDNGEQALEITHKLIQSGRIAIIVVDSVAALVPKAELEGDMGDPQMGLQARLMSQALRKLTGMTNQTKTVLIFINQIREKIGVMFGSPETTTGGRALKFFASVRLDIRKKGLLKNGDVVIGAETMIKVVKNKLASPHTWAEVHLLYGHGVSHERDLIQLGEANNVLRKSGTWFSYGDNRLGQGAEQTRIFLLQNPEIASKIEADLRAILFPKEVKSE